MLSATPDIVQHLWLPNG